MSQRFVTDPRMFGRKKNSKRNLYYIFPVSGKAMKRKYFTLLFVGIGTGLLIGGIMAGLLWLLNRP